MMEPLICAFCKESFDETDDFEEHINYSDGCATTKLKITEEDNLTPAAA